MRWDARLPFLAVLCSFLPAAAAAGDYATYIGDAYPYQVTALTTDAAGNTYLTGYRAIPGAPNAPVLTDVFVTKLDSSGNLVLTVTLSGNNGDQGHGIAVDSSGNIWVAGVTSSPGFPLRNPLQATPGLVATGFLTKLGPDGTVLFSTFFGGTEGKSTVNAVAVDASGDAYITGSTFAPDYVHTPGLPAGEVSFENQGIAAAYFAKISAAGDKIIYAGGVSATTHACGQGSTCYLGEIVTSGTAIAVDSADNAYVAGNAGGVGLPTTSGALRTDGIGAFVMKVNPRGTGLVYLTMLGSANYVVGGDAPVAGPGNTVLAIAADAAGNAYITGATSDPDFPATSSALQPSFSIPTSQISPLSVTPSDAFAAELNPSGTAMVWATFLGGAGADQGQSIAVDGSGNVWVSGTTSSADFLATGGWPQGPEFLVEFNASGSALSYASRFPANTVGTSIALDASGAVHAAGATGIVSEITPSRATAPRLFGIASSAGGALAGRFAPGELISLYGENFGVAKPTSSSFNSAGFLPETLAGVQVSIGGAPAPLLYVSDTQINAVAPTDLTSPSFQEVQVTLNGVPLPDFRTAIDPTDPLVFLNPDGSAAAINQDGSVNSPSHPAAPGTIVAIWATGTGRFYGADGQEATAAQLTCSCTIQSGTDSLSVTYSGAAPGLVNGVTQIDFQIPSNSGATNVEAFYLLVSGAASSATFVYVSQ